MTSCNEIVIHLSVISYKDFETQTSLSPFLLYLRHRRSDSDEQFKEIFSLKMMILMEP